MINFSLVILEYTDSANLVSCLTKWIDLLKPELKQHFHDSMLYKINEVVPYENSNQLDSELDSVSDSFDIGGI